MVTRKCHSKKDELCLRLSLSIFCTVRMFVKRGNTSSWYRVFDGGIVVRFLIRACRLHVGPTQPPMQRISGRGGEYVFLRVKRPVREAEHVTQFSAEVKNDWSCTSITAYAFMAIPPPPYATVNNPSTYQYTYKTLRNQVLVIPGEMPNCLNA